MEKNVSFFFVFECNSEDLARATTDWNHFRRSNAPMLDSILTLDRVIFDVFIGQGGCHCQGVTPDTGSDVWDAERQSAPFALVDQARHDGASVQYSFSHAEKGVRGDVSLKSLEHWNHVLLYILQKANT